MLDMPVGERWFRMAAEGGHAEAQFMLGQIYQFGTAAHARHLETAAACFTGAAQQVRLRCTLCEHAECDASQ